MFKKVFTDEQIAAVIHDSYRAITIFLGQPGCPTWADLPADDWHIPSTLESIKSMRAGDTDFKVQHDRWLAERIADGWTNGPVKDNVKKTNPLLVPWELIPESEKAKNYLRLAIFNAMDKVTE